jgi:hypothetical protein
MSLLLPMKSGYRPNADLCCEAKGALKGTWSFVAETACGVCASSASTLCSGFVARDLAAKKPPNPAAVNSKKIAGPQGFMIVAQQSITVPWVVR